MGFESFSAPPPEQEPTKKIPEQTSLEAISAHKQAPPLIEPSVDHEKISSESPTEVISSSNANGITPQESTMPKEDSADALDAKKQEVFEREDRENITRALGTLSDHLEEFSSTLRRGRFPRTPLDTEGMNLGRDAEINPVDLSQKVEDLRKSISRIKFMEDGGMVSVDVRSLRTVGDEIETLVSDGFKLRRTFENTRSVDLNPAAKVVGRLIYTLKEKKDQADDLVGLALRYNRR